MGEVDHAATLLQVPPLGITSMTDQVGILGRIEYDLRHRFRHLDLRAGDLVARPSDYDLASLSRQGMPGAAALRAIDKSEGRGGGYAAWQACT